MLEKLFPSNMHAIDRGIRVVLGVAILGLTFLGPQSWWGLLGAIPLLTGLVGTCPLYTLFGISTCSVKATAPPSPGHKAA